MAGKKIKIGNLRNMLKNSDVTGASTVEGDVIASLYEEIAHLKKEVARQNELVKSLEKDAMHDPLTNLVNRRVLEEEISRSLSNAKRHKRQSALLMIDLNSFKTINDSLGHATGDRVLIHVANLLRKNTRPNDVVARYGGDEFCVILNEVSSVISANRRAEHLAEIIASTPCISEKGSIHVAVSIGVKLFNEHNQIDEIIEQADKEMYIQKAALK